MQMVINTLWWQKKLKFVNPTLFGEAKAKWFWWFLVLILILFVQILTIDVLPHLQQDEVQITDYGRLALHPLSDWSVTWLVSEEKPLLLWSYVGPLIAEISYQLGGGSGLGPRIASLVGGIFAATMVFGWLISRKISSYAAFAIGIAFLLDPLFVLSQRMGRVDAWVIGCCIASCWLLHLARNKKGHRYSWNVTGAGGFAAIAAFTWPSAIFLYPLIILELLELPTERAISIKSQYLVNKIILFGIGGLFSSILLLLPIQNNILTIFSNMSSVVSQNVDAAKSFEDQLFSLFDFQHWIKLSKTYVKTLSPIFPLLALAAIIIKKEKGLIFSLVCSMAIIFASLVYEFRALYLLPYFVVLYSGLFIQNPVSDQKFWKKHFRKFTLVILVLWSVGISLVTRTAMGLENKANLNREKLYKIASSTVGKGEYKVFLNYTYELYYAGRSLGWKIYTPYIHFSYDQKGNWIRSFAYEEEPEFTELLRQMDFAVFSEGSVNKILQQQLNQAGLHLEYGSNQTSGKDYDPHQMNSRNKEIVLYFLRGKETYGSYVFYGRNKGM